MVHAALKTSLLALMLGAPLAAHAADLYEGPGPYQAPPYGAPYGPPAVYPAPPSYGPPPVMRERLGGFEHCRIFQRVRIDFYGREVLHRVRVCDEPVVPHAAEWVPLPRYGYGHAPSAYDVPPPTRRGGPDFDDE